VGPVVKNWSNRLLITLVGCLVSLVVLTATMGTTFQTEADVSLQIATESPYVKDQSLILYRLEQIERKLDLLLKAK